MQRQDQSPVTDDISPTSLVSGLGLLAALAALIGASCCILPLLLANWRLRGAWMANLGSLIPYQPYILGTAASLLVTGWYVALKRKAHPRVLVILSLPTAVIAASVLVSVYERPLS